MADPARPANIVADRYLVSPTALAGNPSGPVDALDTHSGRASQVRLVFLTGAWSGDDLADAIERWRGIACGEVCGVLDFGRHHGTWYLALPPSLGVPVVRWRAMRLPGPADAARLVLGFGRLVERVAAAGFEPELAGVDDFAVGPGPTPFLERPLLPLPGADPAAPPGGGQRMLARLLDALIARRDIPAALGGWAERAAGGGFASLGACLDELERTGTEAVAHGDAEPPGLSGIFADDELDAMERAADRVPGRRRRIAAVVAGAVVAALTGLALVNPGAPAEKAAPPRRPLAGHGADHDARRADRPARPPPPPEAGGEASAPSPEDPPAPRRHPGPRLRRPPRRPPRPHRPRRRRRRPSNPADRPCSRRREAPRCRRHNGGYHRRVRTPTDDELRLYEAARAAARRAYAPYSSFPVGAALQPAGGGEPLLGVNVENASYGLTSCAERNAVFAAVTAGVREFSAVAVHADAGSAPPCGACRQVLAEFGPEMTVVYRSGGDVVATALAELLPDRFVP